VKIQLPIIQAMPSLVTSTVPIGAVDAMASWAFDVAGFHRLDLEHAVANTASCRVAEKTGFAVEGAPQRLAAGRRPVRRARPRAPAGGSWR
jgi:RimJ/RimL family protein N-acetyltransferase